MEILLPAPLQVATNWQQMLRKTAGHKPLEPFADLLIDFVQTISGSILRDKTFRDYPELMAMAHWFRATHLKEIKQHYHHQCQGKIWLPRGVVLHFAPANVDTIFMYSWFIALLAGNTNLVRLSQNRGEQTGKLIKLLSNILSQERFAPVRQRNLVISYGHQEEITKTLSEFCQVRVIWGGNETIKSIRSIPLPPNATELVFADKFSLAVFEAAKIISIAQQELAKLATDFYNDVFWFNQMACSSPRLVVWVGDQKTITKAQQLFWLELERTITSKPLEWGAEVGITRMATGYSYAIQGWTDKLSTAGTALPYRVSMKTVHQEIKEQHCGGGLFIETERPVLSDVLSLLSYQDQTMIYYGFDAVELEQFACQLGGLGIDRIVPVGQALDFQLVWDGYDLLTYFTREVTVKKS